jgi:hypothetical protein
LNQKKNEQGTLDQSEQVLVFQALSDALDDVQAQIEKRGNPNQRSPLSRFSGHENPRGNSSATAPPPVPKSKDGVEIPQHLQEIYNKSDAITQAVLTEQFHKLDNNIIIAIGTTFLNNPAIPPPYVKDEHEKKIYYLMRTINGKITDSIPYRSHRAWRTSKDHFIPENVVDVLLLATEEVKNNFLVNLNTMTQEDLRFIGAFYPMFLYSQKQKTPNNSDDVNAFEALSATIAATENLKNNFNNPSSNININDININANANTQKTPIVSQFFNQTLSGNLSSTGNQQPPGGNPSSSGNQNQQPPANPLAQNMPTQDELAPILKTFWDDMKGWFSGYINTSNTGILALVRDSPFGELHRLISASTKYKSNIKNPNTPFVVKLGSTTNNNHHVFLQLLNWDTQDAQLTVFVNEIDTDVFDETKTNNVKILMPDYEINNESADLTLTMYDEPIGDILLDFIICVAREMKIDELKVQDIRLFGKGYHFDANTNQSTNTVEDVLLEKYPLLKQVAGQNFFSRLPGRFGSPKGANTVQTFLTSLGNDKISTGEFLKDVIPIFMQRRSLSVIQQHYLPSIINEIQNEGSIAATDKDAFLGFTIDTTLNAKCYENAGNNGPTKGGARGRPASARSVRRGRRGSGRSSSARQQRSHGTTDANPTAQPRTRKRRRGQRRATATA